MAKSRASTVSSLTPAAPYVCTARSTTLCATSMATTLIAATSDRAAAFPCVSISHDAFSVSNRAWSISTRLRAIHSRTTPWSARGPPNASRSTARRHIIDSARSANPIARMA
jgi:hypothetical protein